MLVDMAAFQAHLVKGLSPADTKLYLAPDKLKALDRIGVGNHTVLRIKSGAFVELVRYDHTEDYKQREFKDFVHITRNVDGTGHKTFPKGVCVDFVWTDDFKIKEVCDANV